MRFSVSFEEFLAAFTISEQLAMVGSADARTKLLLLRLSAKGSVRGDDPIVITGLNFLVSLGLITQLRADQVLAIINARTPE